MQNATLLVLVTSLLTGCATIDHTDVFTLREQRVPVSAVVLPESLDRSTVQEISITAEGRTFYGYRVAAKEPKRAVLFFPGNGYGASSSVGRLSPLFHDSVTDLYVVSYGLSSEEPPLVGQAFALGTELARFASKTSGIPQTRLRAVGHSLGGWVALNTASSGDVGCVAVVGAGTTATETAKNLLPKPIAWMLRLTATPDVELLNNPLRAQGVTVPLLVVGSKADEIMPPANSEAIFRSAKNPASARMFISDTATHGSYFRDVEVQSNIRSFFAEKCEH
jgi:pimeloyl-ACP methyl ester carboxylesterase